MRMLLVVFLVLLTGCRGQNKDSTTSEMAVDSSLPGTQRAAAAAERVTPLLAPRLQQLDLKMGCPVFLRAFKEEKELELWMQPPNRQKFVLFDTYPIAGSSGRLGPKTAEGDRQVPEGFYYFGRRQLNPNSRYHLAFNIGYPNTYDRYHQHTGSFIMVHGNTISVGCLAMTDAKIEEIYTICDAALNQGQPFVRIHLFPFRMTKARIEKAASHPSMTFWKNLKEGYDRFETSMFPPKIGVQDGHYVMLEEGPN